MSPEERAAELRHCVLAAAGARGTHAGFVATLCRERERVRAESKAEVEALAVERDAGRAENIALKALLEAQNTDRAALAKRVAELERQVDELENALLEAGEAADR